jgi:hypothetical protein
MIPIRNYTYNEVYLTHNEDNGSCMQCSKMITKDETYKIRQRPNEITITDLWVKNIEYLNKISKIYLLCEQCHSRWLNKGAKLKQLHSWTSS